jgi:hypothetical protein
MILSHHTKEVNMPNILKPNQPARLLPETVKAVQAYRRSIERETKSTPSINASLNALIIIGWNCVENHPAELSEPDTQSQRREALKGTVTK